MMPWYTNHTITSKVLNRIAKHYEHAGIQDLKFILDNATESIWRKQEHYYRTTLNYREVRDFGAHNGLLD